MIILFSKELVDAITVLKNEFYNAKVHKMMFEGYIRDDTFEMDNRTFSFDIREETGTTWRLRGEQNMGQMRGGLWKNGDNFKNYSLNLSRSNGDARTGCWFDWMVQLHKDLLVVTIQPWDTTVQNIRVFASLKPNKAAIAYTDRVPEPTFTQTLTSMLVEDGMPADPEPEEDEEEEESGDEE